MPGPGTELTTEQRKNYLRAMLLDALYPLWDGPKLPGEVAAVLVAAGCSGRLGDCPRSPIAMWVCRELGPKWVQVDTKIITIHEPGLGFVAAVLPFPLAAFEIAYRKAAFPDLVELYTHDAS